MRYPAIPLITVDPYFNVYSFNDTLNGGELKHWTGASHNISGYVSIDGNKYHFMGRNEYECPEAQQTGVKVEALSTSFSFQCGLCLLKAVFTTPLLIDDLPLMSRPISYLETEVVFKDRMRHKVEVEVILDDELSLNRKGEYATVFSRVPLKDMTIACAKTGSTIQNVLSTCGDDLRINYGYAYIAVKEGKISDNDKKFRNILESHKLAALTEREKALFVFAYDDVKSLNYFGNRLDCYYKGTDENIEAAIEKSFNQYESIKARCDAFTEKLTRDAEAAGGKEYADLLNLSYRQAVSAHKLCDSEDGLIWVSKENFSNGCAATVDVTMPSAPLFLLFNPELVNAMLRPVMHYAESPEWIFDFAPHDAGVFPLVTGQAYSDGTDPRWQMPMEECGNILVLAYAAAAKLKDNSFIVKFDATLKKWADYLDKHMFSAESELCTDDFAGHLKSNTNLFIKAIMGIAAYGKICGLQGRKEEEDRYISKAKIFAAEWLEKAKKKDGTFMLALGEPDSFSLKYNLYWDEVFKTGIFDKKLFKKEFESYVDRANRYGTPLDNRADYTKSDWLIYIAALCEDKESLQIIKAVWRAYDESPSRVPMTDWYDTKTAKQCGFQARSVVGGFFAKLLV